jgi:lipopolysaccharide export system permease protein
LTLYSGEWFENMRSQDLANSANIPYRRETFSTKHIVIDFDSGLNLTDMADIAGDARMKSLDRLLHDIDSIKEHNDSIGYSFFLEAKRFGLRLPAVSAEDSVKIMKQLATDKTDFDSIYERKSPSDRQAIVKSALASVQSVKMEVEMKAEYAHSLHRYYRHHQLEAIKKFTLSLACLIFFFIGAPLGAIIRKGGLGVPVIVSVLVFIIYYIFDNSGFRMAREDQWTVWFGMTISTWTLSPVAAFFTYKANKDSVVFNLDLYKQIVSRILGLRTKRSITRKDVIIEDPKYLADAEMLRNVSIDIERYSEEHHLLRWPNPIKVFFHSGDDHDIESINNVLEMAIEDLSYTRNNYVLMKLNQFPVIATHAHTRPFQRKWLNAITGLFLPTGLFFYIRMIRFRIRLYRDLQHIIRVNNKLIPRVVQLGDLQTEKSNI